MLQLEEQDVKRGIGQLMFVVWQLEKNLAVAEARVKELLAERGKVT